MCPWALGSWTFCQDFADKAPAQESEAEVGESHQVESHQVGDSGEAEEIEEDSEESEGSEENQEEDLSLTFANGTIGSAFRKARTKGPCVWRVYCWLGQGTFMSPPLNSCTCSWRAISSEKHIGNPANCPRKNSKNTNNRHHT